MFLLAVSLNAPIKIDVSKEPNVAVFQHRVPYGVASGTCLSNSWQTLTVNRQGGNLSFADANTNQISVAKGIYYIQAKASAYDVGDFKIRLYNIKEKTVTFETKRTCTL